MELYVKRGVFGLGDVLYFFLVVLFGSMDQTSARRTSVSTSSLADLGMWLCCNGTYGCSHHNIWRDAHVPQHTYRYYDAVTKGLDFKGLMEDVKVNFLNQLFQQKTLYIGPVQIVKSFQFVMGTSLGEV